MTPAAACPSGRLTSLRRCATRVLTDVTRAATDIGDMLPGDNATDRSEARKRVIRTLPVFVGLAVGYGPSVACEAALELWSLALPVGLDLHGCAIGLAAPVDAQR